MSTDYEAYSYHRDSFRTDDWLKGEPTIMASHAAFIVNGATLILNHHFDGEGLAGTESQLLRHDHGGDRRNGARLTLAVSLPVVTRTAVVATRTGCLPAVTSMTDLPTVQTSSCTSRQYWASVSTVFSASTVGGYMAYRDGRRQEMYNAAGGDPINMLTRWSMDFPELRCRWYRYCRLLVWRYWSG